MAQSYGSKRVVVGAHYGLFDWLSQRFTAVAMALFTLAIIVQVVFGGPIGYDRWAAIFSQQWMKVMTFVTVLALFHHVWVGMRDIWMDYIKQVWLRLSLDVITIAWLLGYSGWAIQVIWRL